MYDDWGYNEDERAVPVGSGVLWLLFEAAIAVLAIVFFPYRLYRRLRHRG
jgi:hypothetical protein